MRVRPYEPGDAEEVHALYAGLVAHLPHHRPVTLEQLAAEILTSRHRAGRRQAPEENGSALVADHRGRVAAFVRGTYTPVDLNDWPETTETGLLEWLVAGPEDEESARAAIRAALAELDRHQPRRVYACAYSFGPTFHNEACAMLPSAWAWLGHWLGLERFAPQHGEIRLRKPLTGPVERPTLPPGAELRAEPTRFAHVVDEGLEPDTNSFCRHLRIGDEEAGQCHCYWSEAFIAGAGHGNLYVSWLGISEAWRGRGLGRVLLRNAIAHAAERGAASVTLTTGAENYRAQALYFSEGFRLVDVMWQFERKPA
jgi:GNAT superfamily N-acetyltransferase